MADWHGYFHLRVSNSLTGAQLLKAARAIRALGRQKDDQPAFITHARISTNSRAMIGEIVLPSSITRAQVKTALANELGVSEATVEANIVDFTVFAGADWETSRQAAVAFLIANAADWGEA